MGGKLDNISYKISKWITLNVDNDGYKNVFEKQQIIFMWRIRIEYDRMMPDDKVLQKRHSTAPRAHAF